MVVTDFGVIVTDSGVVVTDLSVPVQYCRIIFIIKITEKLDTVMACKLIRVQKRNHFNFIIKSPKSLNGFKAGVDNWIRSKFSQLS